VQDVSITFRTLVVAGQMSRSGERIPAKTHESRRTVPLSQSVLDVLEGLLPTDADPGSLVFSTRGAAIRQNTYHVAFKAAVTRAGLRSTLSSHDLRHHYATTLVRAGMSPVAVGRLLGHTDGSLVGKTYASWMPADDALARRALDAVWSDDTNSSSASSAAL
jgi:integrase